MGPIFLAIDVLFDFFIFWGYFQLFLVYLGKLLCEIDFWILRLFIIFKITALALYINYVRSVICEGWHFNYTWKTLAWPNHFTKKDKIEREKNTTYRFFSFLSSPLKDILFKNIVICLISKIENIFFIVFKNDILITRGKHLHDRIISQKRGGIILV
jgi:hypothetical protein